MFIKLVFPFSRLSFCVIGGGPAGLYTAKLLSQQLSEPPRITILQRHVCPFGLVRYGVAPDHQQVKKVSNTLRKVFDSDLVSFHGNTMFNGSLKQLQEHYSGIVLSQGAGSQHKLNCNKDFLSAREVVGWYNSQPPYSRYPISFKDKQHLLLIGNGNVALDIARLVLKKKDLRSTDISLPAFQQLKQNKIRRVSVVGRRGIGQSAFTLRQIREIHKVPGVQLFILREELKKSLNSATEQQMYDALALQQSRLVRRKVQFLQANCKVVDSMKQLDEQYKPGSVQMVLRFLLQPDSTQNNRVRFTKMRLEGASFNQRAVKIPQQYQEIDSDMVVTSLGYIPQRIEQGIHTEEGTVANRAGLLLDQSGGSLRNGLFTAGWAKTGCKGVIDSTLLSCQQTVNNIRLLSESLPARDCLSFEAKLREGGSTSFADFERLEAWERREGQRLNKIALKAIDTQQMLRVIR